MSGIKDTVLSTVLPIIEDIAAVVLFTPQERDQGRKFEQRVMFFSAHQPSIGKA